MVLFTFLKYLDKSTYGEYVLYQGNLAFFLLIFSQNLYIYTNLKIPGLENPLQFSYLKTSFTFIIIGILVSSLALYFLDNWFNTFVFFGLNKIALQFLLVATLEIIIVEFIRFFLAIQEVTKRNNLQLIQRLSFFVFLAFNVFFLKNKMTFDNILMLLFLAQVCAISYILINIDIVEFIKSKLIISDFMRNAYKIIIPFLPIAFSTTIINYTDRFLINHFLDIDSLAEYGIISQIISMSNMLIGMSVILPFFPYAVSAYNNHKNEESLDFFKKMMSAGLIIAVTFSIFFIINYSWFLNLIGNGKYKNSDLLVLLMSFNTVLYVIITTLAHYFQLINNIKKVIIISVSCMVLNVILNYFLIQYFGIVGSAISSITTLIIMSTALFFHGLNLNKQFFNSLFFKKSFFNFMSSIIVIAVLLFGLNNYIYNSILEVILKNIIGLLIVSFLIFFNLKAEFALVIKKIQARI